MIRSITFILLLATFSSIAADYDFSGELIKKKLVLNRRKKFPAGFNLYVAGPVGIASGSFDYFITPKLSLEVGGGFRSLEGDICLEGDTIFLERHQSISRHTLGFSADLNIQVLL